MSRWVLVVYRSALSQIRLSMARSMVRFVTVVQPIVFSTISFFMLRDSGITGYGEYVVTGSGLITLWMTTLWSSATDIDRERWMGTLELLLISPTPFPLILLGKILGNTVLGYIAFGLAYLFSLVGLRISLPLAHPLEVAVCLVAMAVAFLGFALFLGLLFTLSRRANVIANGLSFPMYLVSGVYFPLTSLPAWVGPFGLLTPLAWAKEALRWAVVGQEAGSQMLTSSFWFALGGLVVIGAVYYTAAHLLYRHIVHNKIRRLGQLGLA